MRSSPPECELVLVLDENLSSPRILEVLKNQNIPVKLQTDIMSRGITDEEVLKALSHHPNHYLISKDKDFHRKPAIRSALIKHKIGTFFITTQKGKTANELAEIITLAWRKIPSFIKKNNKPFVGKILSNGKIVL